MAHCCQALTIAGVFGYLQIALGTGQRDDSELGPLGRHLMGCAGKGDRVGLFLAACRAPPPLLTVKFAGPQLLCLPGDSRGLAQGHVCLLLLLLMSTLPDHLCSQEMERCGGSLTKPCERLRRGGAEGRCSQNIQRDSVRLLHRGLLKTAA